MEEAVPGHLPLVHDVDDVVVGLQDLGNRSIKGNRLLPLRRRGTPNQRPDLRYRSRGRCRSACGPHILDRAGGLRRRLGPLGVLLRGARGVVEPVHDGLEVGLELGRVEGAVGLVLGQPGLQLGIRVAEGGGVADGEGGVVGIVGFAGAEGEQGLGGAAVVFIWVEALPERELAVDVPVLQLGWRDRVSGKERWLTNPWWSQKIGSNAATSKAVMWPWIKVFPVWDTPPMMLWMLL